MNTLFCLLLTGFLFYAVKTENIEFFDVLTENLLDNFYGDPHLIGTIEFTNETKQYIDKQVENYLKIVDRMYDENDQSSSKSKRSLPIDSLDKLTTDPNGTYVLNAIIPSQTVPAVFPKSVKLFLRGEIWYAAALVTSEPKENADGLVIFKQNGMVFEEIVNEPVRKGQSLAIYSHLDSTFITVSENVKVTEKNGKKTPIFQFTSDEKLKIVQHILPNYSFDVEFWDLNKDIFLAVSEFNCKNESQLSVLKTTIYVWRDAYFDVMQTIETKGSIKITPFNIGGSQFLAIANFNNKEGTVKTYSDIYKYSTEKGTFEIHQKLLTTACMDIKFFSFTQNPKVSEHFLVVANYYDLDINGNKNYNTNSILYKFVDGYFIPFQSFKLNGIEQWLPVTGPKKEFALFGLSKFEGIKIYQYDGWNFIESNRQYFGESYQKGVNDLNFYVMNNTPTIVVSNENSKGDVTNVLNLNFTHVNNLKNFQEDMMEWCLNATENLINIETTTRRKRDGDEMKIPGRSDTDIEIEENIPKTTTTIPENLNDHNEMEEIKLTLTSLNLLLDTIEEQSIKTLQSNQGEHVIKNDIITEILTLKNDSHIENFNSQEINSIQTTDLMENTVNINEGFAITSPMIFNFLRIDHDISPKSINGKQTLNLVKRDKLNEVNNLVVNGRSVVLENIKAGAINGETINGLTVLQNKQQTLNDTVVVETTGIGSLETKALNGRDLADSELQQPKFVKLSKLDTLEARSVLVGEYINDVDMGVLDKYSLRQFGDQTLTKSYYFDDLQISDLSVPNLNNVTPDDLFVTTRGDSIIKINRDVYFHDVLNVNALIALEHFNSIKVTKGQLDVLLKNSSEIQYIPAHKEFENLVLLKALNLQGKINSEALDKYNPVKTVTNDLELNLNYTISGEVFIEEFLKVNDISTTDFKGSLGKLIGFGLGLNESEIPVKLQFVEELHVDEVFVDEVNGINPDNWVVNGEGYPPQVIEGFKQFDGDVVVSRASEAVNINGVDFSKLGDDVLTVNGDQVIFGELNVAKIVASSVQTNNTQFGNKNWNDVKISKILKDESGFTYTINKNVKTDFAKTNELQTDGLINGLNFDEIYEDTVTQTKNNNSKIPSQKTIKNLQIDNLSIEGVNIEDFEEIYDELINDGLKIETDFEFLAPIAIENINFTENCNDLSGDLLGEQPLQKNKHSTYTTGLKKIKKIIVFGKTIINSNKINGVDIQELVENSVKLDESFDFETVTFDSQIITKEIKTNGKVEIEGLDLKNLIHKNSETEQIIMDQKIFKNLTIKNGAVTFHGPINNFEYDHLCEFTDPKSAKNVVIEGNAMFTKGPDVHKINEHSVDKILSTMWLSNSPINMNGPIEFEDVIFKKDVLIKGKVDGVNITNLAENYFSKTKNQTVTGSLEFARGVVFGQDVITPFVSLKGLINGVDLNAFLGTALLNDTDQVFEDALFIENCTINGVNGNFKVNDFDLENDVMRYDKQNMVTGSKNITNLNVETLKLDKDIQVQNVYILHLLKNSVQKTGNTNVSGKKKFLKKAQFSKALSLTGKLNGNEFNSETILLKNAAQTVTGKKIFLSDNLDPIRIKHIKLKGNINGVNLNEVVENQAMKNTDNAFKSKMRFNRDISVKHLTIEKLYQGVNVTELMINVTNLNVMNNFDSNYNKLLNMSNQLYDSLKTQAYYLDFYKQIESFRQSELLKVILLKCQNDDDVLVTFNSKSTNILSLYKWSDGFEMYVDTTNTINLHTYPVYVQKLTVDAKDFLYLEYLNGEEKFARLMTFKNSTFLQPVANFKTPQHATEMLEPFILPGFNKTCLIYMLKMQNSISVYCDTGRDTYNLYQILNSPTPHQISVVHVQNVPYIVVINKEEKEAFVQIWKMKENHFQPHQVIYVAEPKSVSAICAGSNCFLAIASGYMENTMHPGMIDIFRFDSTTEEFQSCQVLNVKAPIQLTLTILPSNELVLYILTETPMQPLIVYMYQGISGFKQHLIASTLMKTYNINHFNTRDLKHFIIAENHYGTDLIQAVFKGKKWT